jgi:hypothetical protein
MACSVCSFKIANVFNAFSINVHWDLTTAFGEEFPVPRELICFGSFSVIDHRF